MHGLQVKAYSPLEHGRSFPDGDWETIETETTVCNMMGEREVSKITQDFFLSGRIAWTIVPFTELGTIEKEPIWRAVGDINEFSVKYFWGNQDDFEQAVGKVFL